jgi:hypothetical protein
MRVREIHAAVEELLGAPVAYSAVKEALSAHARSSIPVVRRIRRGWYELRNEQRRSLSISDQSGRATVPRKA